MTTEIKVWQIENQKLKSVETRMAGAGRTEQKDLEQWIKNNPNILGEDILIIGEQVQTRSGRLDFLGIDETGNAVIVELKRDMIPRDALTQAIDYASDIAFWDSDKLSEECEKYTNQQLDACISERFENINLEEVSFNQTQRILLVGTSIEDTLQRMIEWLSDNYEVTINAILLKYIKTKSGDELLARTMIIPEEIEKEIRKRQQRKIQYSEVPGNYDNDELKKHLRSYLSKKDNVPNWIKEILLPLCLDHEPVTRKDIIDELIKRNEAEDLGKAGALLSAISRILVYPSYDFLRQVIKYDRPSPGEKDNYRIDEKYKNLVQDLLNEMKRDENKIVTEKNGN